MSTFGAVVSALAALLAYFGYVRANAYYRYLSLDTRLLALDYDDYLFRNAGTYFKPAGVLIFATALTIVGAAIVRRQGRSTRRWHTYRVVVPLALSTVLIVVGLAVALGVPVPTVVPVWAVAAALAVGGLVLLQLAGSPAVAWLHRELLVIAAAAVVLGAFWATTIYAHTIGSRLAHATIANPERSPEAVLLTEDLLDMPGDEVSVTSVALTADRTGYRYVGARVLTYANDRWFLITGRVDDRLSIVVVPDSENLIVRLKSQISETEQ